MNLAKIEINDFGGAPIAEHNMPCAVCGTNHAVLEIGFGYFSPCWECQKKGWELTRKPTGPWYKRWYKRIKA